MQRSWLSPAFPIPTSSSRATNPSTLKSAAPSDFWSSNYSSVPASSGSRSRAASDESNRSCDPIYLKTDESMLRVRRPWRTRMKLRLAVPISTCPPQHPLPTSRPSALALAPAALLPTNRDVLALCDAPHADRTSATSVVPITWRSTAQTPERCARFLAGHAVPLNATVPRGAQQPLPFSLLYLSHPRVGRSHSFHQQRIRASRLLWPRMARAPRCLVHPCAALSSALGQSASSPTPSPVPPMNMQCIRRTGAQPRSVVKSPPSSYRHRWPPAKACHRYLKSQSEM